MFEIGTVSFGYIYKCALCIYAFFLFDLMSTWFYATVAETGSEDDGHLDLTDDDFFLAGSSSDEADADDEWTDKSRLAEMF